MDDLSELQHLAERIYARVRAGRRLTPPIKAVHRHLAIAERFYR